MLHLLENTYTINRFSLLDTTVLNTFFEREFNMPPCGKKIKHIS